MPRKAVALISGGLDSMLAAKAIIEQGVHVEGINFFTGFCVEGHTHAIRKRDDNRTVRNNALWVAEQLGIKLHFIDVVEQYKRVVLNPRHGYGAHMNPCLDCKSFMVRHAHAWMIENDFDFIITGEVIGQRPKSQRKATMPIIANESGAGDRLLRPLCAKRLTPTLPETEGWVRRDELFEFTGRSRKPQMALAEQYGFVEYAQPAGGCCFLTDKQYATKMTDLFVSRGKRDYELDDIMLLKVGRHLRPRAHFKVIIGREEGENNYLSGYRGQFTSMRSSSHPGPIALIDGETTPDDLQLAARLLARFCQGRDEPEVEIELRPAGGAVSQLTVVPLASADVPKDWYV
ncbi:MAG: tRNA (5-methylaminomethyl-2-thiouridylate)-methyltransferase [Gammaproteobacteria bacterium]|nr:tRNA (5-methylaminomethyl-2-thiouridylate)-methyltransferase [Gammaproteobacteria bacterium]